MSLTLNIGLSRKVGEPNYGSRGAMVNLQVEVEAAVVNEPDRFRERVRALFGLLRTSLAEELNGNGHAVGTTQTRGNTGQPVLPNGTPPKAMPPATGKSDSRGTGQRLATAAQVKAIWAISRSQQVDIRQLLRERFRLSRPDDLTIFEASSLIDELKAAEAGG